MAPSEVDMGSGKKASSLKSFAINRGIRFFLVSFVDLLGVLRSKLVPTSAIDDIAQNGAGFAGFAAHFAMTAADPDVLAFPDVESVIQLPWKPEVAWVASDLHVNGSLMKQAPRQVLKDQIRRASDMGYMMKTGVECEFFLLKSVEELDVQAADTAETAPKPCYRQGALMRRFDFISQLLQYMESLGWKPYQADHEDGKSQFEINWNYDGCLATADKHVFFKFMGFKQLSCRNLCEIKLGMDVIVMYLCGLWTPQEDVNLFQDSTDEMGLSSLAYNFLAGVLNNIKACCAIYNPTVNSYKRLDGQNTLSGSTWAPPLFVSYSGNNRTHMVRIPDKGRFELRLADGAVNPYLLQAALLASGLVGIRKNLECEQRCDWNAHEQPPAKGLGLQKVIPRNLLDAIRELDNSEEMKQGLGESFVEGYCQVQTLQWNSYSSCITRWELENTLDC